jgi:hypothetical protein
MPYRIFKTLSPVEAAYMAGLIDGEGTVTLSRRHRNDQRQLVVSIANTERRLLEWTFDTVGAGRKANLQSTTLAQLHLFDCKSSGPATTRTNRAVPEVLQSHAQLALQNYINLTPRNGRYTEEIRAERDRFLTTVLGIKASVPPDLARL